MTKKITCLAPWVHSHIQPSNKRSICCLQTDHHDVQTHAEFWNGEYMKSVRVKFLNGEHVKGCEHCLGDAVNREEGTRYYESFDAIYGNKVDEIIASTSQTGETSYVPVDFDYRTSLCNLSCKTCGTDASSTIASYSNRSAGKKVIPIVNYKSSFSRQWDDVEKLLSPDTKKMYWAGGEPTMNPIYWKTLEYLTEKEWFDVYMVYHINLMTLNDPELYSKALNNFERFNSHVNVSIDGIGTVGEYVRNGLNWELFDTLYTKLISDAKRTKVVLDVTMTNLTFLQLPEILNYAISKNGKIFFKAMFETPGFMIDGLYHNNNDFLSLNLIQTDTFNRIIAEVDQIMENNEIETNLREFIEFLRGTHAPRFMTHADNEACRQMEERHGNTISLVEIIKAQSLDMLPSKY